MGQKIRPFDCNHSAAYMQRRKFERPRDPVTGKRGKKKIVGEFWRCPTCGLRWFAPSRQSDLCRYRAVF